MTTHEMPEGRPAASNLYAQIVVALDGSARVELVLPYAVASRAWSLAALPTRCCGTRHARSYSCV